MSQSMPFCVTRDKQSSLIDQVVEGVRHAIVTGYYRTGDTLPNLNDMAAALGVSEIVTRRAVQRLSRDGLLSPRRGTGIAVCGTDAKTWRGHVLFVHWSGAGMYYHAILSGEMTERLHAANVLVSSVHVSGADAATAYSKVRAELGHVVSLAVIEGSADDLDALLSERGIPFIHIHRQDAACSPLAVAGLAVSDADALCALQVHCRACGARRILHVRDKHKEGVSRAFSFDASLFSVATLPVLPVPGLDNPEAVERGGLLAMEAWLDKRPELPDLIWFDDDFMARGALLVMAARGIRIPEDVQVATWANKGLGPVFLKPLTRVEMDPKAHGAIVARCILDQLDGSAPPDPSPGLSPVFVAGETTRR